MNVSVPQPAAVELPVLHVRRPGPRCGRPAIHLTRFIAAISLIVWAIALIAIGVAIQTGVIRAERPEFFTAAFFICGILSLIFAIAQTRRGG